MSHLNKSGGSALPAELPDVIEKRTDVGDSVVAAGGSSVASVSKGAIERLLVAVGEPDDASSTGP